MNRVLLGGCILLTSSVFTVRAQELKLKHGSVCWPLHISGITLGETNDSEVLRLLGKGLERTGQVETAGRFFTNKGHTATLHVISYTDEVVGEVTLRSPCAIRSTAFRARSCLSARNVSLLFPFENAVSAVSVAPNTTLVTTIVTSPSTSVNPSSRLTWSPAPCTEMTR